MLIFLFGLPVLTSCLLSWNTRSLYFPMLNPPSIVTNPASNSSFKTLTHWLSSFELLYLLSPFPLNQPQSKLKIFIFKKKIFLSPCCHIKLIPSCLLVPNFLTSLPTKIRLPTSTHSNKLLYQLLTDLTITKLIFIFRCSTRPLSTAVDNVY